MDANLNNPAAALIAASQPSTGSTPGALPGLSGGRGDTAVASPDAPPGESEFSSKIKSLEQDSVKETRATETAGSGTEAPRTEATASSSEPANEPASAVTAEGSEQTADTEIRQQAADSDGNALPVTGKELPVGDWMVASASDIDSTQPVIETVDDAVDNLDLESPGDSAEASASTVDLANLPQVDETLTDQDSAQPRGTEDRPTQLSELNRERPDPAIAATARLPASTPASTERGVVAPVTTAATVATPISGAATTAGAPGDNAGMNFDGGSSSQPGMPATAELQSSSAGAAQRVAFSAELPALAAATGTGTAGMPGGASTLTELDALAAARPLQPQAGQEQFARGLGERLLLMADGGLQSARIRISPENLGPLDIRIQVQDDATQVWFNASHGQTREILEQAMPRLRELMADQGMRLTDANVSGGDSGSSETRDGVQPPERDWRQPPPPTLDEQIAGQSLRQLLETRRLLDVYA